MRLSARHWLVALFASGALHAAALALWGAPAPAPATDDERAAGDLAQVAVASSPAEAYAAPGDRGAAVVIDAAEVLEPVRQAAPSVTPHRPETVRPVKPLPVQAVEAPSRIAALAPAEAAEPLDEARKSELAVALPRRKPPRNPAHKPALKSPGKQGAKSAAAPSSAAQGRALAKAGDQGRSSTATGRADLSSWLGHVASSVQRQKRYPDAARRRRAEGTVVVAFTVTRSGALGGVRVSRPSGHPALDGEVLAMVRRAAPFPPIPPGAGKASLSLNLPIRFDIR